MTANIEEINLSGRVVKTTKVNGKPVNAKQFKNKFCNDSNKVSEGVWKVGNFQIEECDFYIGVYSMYPAPAARVLILK